MSDFWQELGVNKNASKEEIRKAYKSKAGKFHPDKGGDEEKFKQIKLAYDTLFNDKSREQYIKTGESGSYRDINAEANNLLSNIFTQMIDADKKGDIIDSVKDHINTQLSNIKNQKHQHEQKLTTYKNKLGRISTLNGDNLFNASIENRIEKFTIAIDKMEEAIHMWNKVLSLANDYNDTNPDPIVTTSYMGTTSSILMR